MQDRHLDRKRYFNEQAHTTKKFVIPYVEQVMQISSKTRVLEVGCGEGGNLMPFLQLGCQCVGVDLAEVQINNARKFMDVVQANYDLELFCQDIYDIPFEKIGQFDLIFLRDVIEHIHDQEKFMGFIKRFLKPNGKIFFGFPPWSMPFGGHQQVINHKILSKLPYFHLLPMSMYKQVLKWGGLGPDGIACFEEIKITGISTQRFEGIIKRCGYQFDLKTRFLINPNYETKFGLKPRVLWSFLWNFPFLNDKITTCYYCVVSSKVD